LRLTPNHAIEGWEKIGHRRVIESGAVVQAWTDVDEIMAKKKLKTMKEISAAEAVKLFHAAMDFHGFMPGLYRPKPECFPKDISANDFMEGLKLYRDMCRDAADRALTLLDRDFEMQRAEKVYAERRAELVNTAAGVPKQELERFTPKELEVFNLLKEGLQDKEIASKLKKGVGTVKVQVSSVLRKLGVDTRTQAVAQAPTDLSRPKQS